MVEKEKKTKFKWNRNSNDYTTPKDLNKKVQKKKNEAETKPQL